MQVSCVLLLPGHNLSVADTLLDTGATSADYMSMDFFLKHRNELEQCTTPVNKKVRLGDGTTLRDIDHVVSIKLRFTDPLEYDIKGGTEPLSYVISVNLNVFQTSHDIIIGIRTLSLQLFDYFWGVFKRSRDIHFADQLVNAMSVATLKEGDLVKPFPHLLKDAPEDAETPLPSHYEDALYFLTTDRDERLKTYYDLFATHVDPEFAKQTPILEFLRSPDCEEVYVPTSWGINGLEPIEYDFIYTPATACYKANNINPKLAEHAREEFRRMEGYMWLPSSSHVASPIVVAPKATKPFIRICGNFSKTVNPAIRMPIVDIPPIKPTLGRISEFRIFLDVDVTNAFHQFELAEHTSNMLSVRTPWGLFRPKYMLEGTTPASGILHSTMVQMFREAEDWSIVLHDNILLMAYDYQDAYQKFTIFIAICKKRNLKLKFEKSWLGVHEVNFFGYVCRHKSYNLSQERTAAILALPFPENTKQMQSFLGSCLFFQSFIPMYSDHAAKLNDMTKKEFRWGDESKWEVDYRAEYDKMKQVLAESFTLFYPDYSLQWILRVDASQMGVGGVLLQDKDNVLQPIMFVSRKFSDQAARWSTIEQEAYAIYYCVHTLQFFLRCKEFIIETDHRNLLFMHHSEVPKIIRWYIFLQSFNFLVRHIPGKQNIVADMLSRQWNNSSVKEFEDTLCHISMVASGEKPNFESVMRQVHGRRVGHLGAKRTWFLMNKMFPGHGFPMAWIRDYVAECPVCQKDRLARVASIPSITKTLHVNHHRSTVGVDTFELPVAEDGSRYLLVLVNFFTHYVYLYPVKHKDAKTTATCIFHYICTFGLFDQLRSDPGSDFTSDMMKQLLDWLGPTRSLTLVNNPQADGVEGTNKQIHRHLLALCMDEGCKKTWSDPTVLPIIQLIINEHTNSETGVVPLHAQFGDADAIYCQIPKDKDHKEATNLYVRLLQDNLKLIRSLSSKHQAEVKAERTKDNPSATIANRYAAGDYVLLILDKSERPDKLSPRGQGPYEVVCHHEDSNWVDVRNLVYDHIETFERNSPEGSPQRR